MFRNVEDSENRDCAPWFAEDFWKLSVDLNLCVCVSFQLTVETADLHSQSVFGLWRRSIGVPLRCRDVWKLQSLLQKSRGRYDIGSGHQTGHRNAATSEINTAGDAKRTDAKSTWSNLLTSPKLMKTLHLKSRLKGLNFPFFLWSYI